MSSTHRLIRVIVTLVLSACSVALVTSEISQSDDADKKPLYKRTGAEGALSGNVSFEGTPPTRKRIDVSQDANCVEIGRNSRTEDVIVSAGKLANVFVYLKGGDLVRFAFETPETGVVLDQQQCRFVPHVLGIQTGQPLTVLNSDPTAHNVHPAPRMNPEWNQSQPANGVPFEKKFMRPETLIPVKCNQHPWMRAYIGVLAHPFFAVSARDGSFHIDRLPPGEYTVIAWHELLGEQTAKVTVGPNERKSVDFAFSAPPAGRTSSLSLMIESPIVVQ